MDEHCGCIVVVVSCIFVFMSFAFGWTVCEFYHSTEPRPIDVYRGKTTLEITYRDSVAVDSVVVFRKKK